MPAPKLIIFDCDGVLIDSEIIASQVECNIYQEFGYEGSPKDFGQRFAGLNSAAIKDLMEDELGRGLPENIIERADKGIDERLAQEVEALPGANTLLDLLDQPRCICSNSSSERLKISLGRAELYDRFRPYIFAAKEVGTKLGKPDPNVFKFAAKELETNPANCVVIEDSAHGIQAAKAAGMRVIGYVGGSHTYEGHGEILMEAGAETIIKHLVEAKEVIDAFAVWDGLPA